MSAVLVLLFVTAAVPALWWSFSGILGSLAPRDEQFTELYIEDYAAFKQGIAAGRTLPFSFTIVNREGATTTYRYVVYAEDARGVRSSLGQERVVLSDGQAFTVDESVRVTPGLVGGQVVVELLNRDQSLRVALLQAP